MATKKKILSVCVRLFLEQGYKQTSVSQIVEEAGVTRGSYQHLFPTCTITCLAGTYNFDPTEYMDQSVYTITEDSGKWTVAVK